MEQYLGVEKKTPIRDIYRECITPKETVFLILCATNLPSFMKFNGASHTKISNPIIDNYHECLTPKEMSFLIPSAATNLASFIKSNGASQVKFQWGKDYFFSKLDKVARQFYNILELFQTLVNVLIKMQKSIFHRFTFREQLLSKILNKGYFLIPKNL